MRASTQATVSAQSKQRRNCLRCEVAELAEGSGGLA
jgi:hypothetical protein